MKPRGQTRGFFFSQCRTRKHSKSTPTLCPVFWGAQSPLSLFLTVEDSDLNPPRARNTIASDDSPRPLRRYSGRPPIFTAGACGWLLGACIHGHITQPHWSCIRCLFVEPVFTSGFLRYPPHDNFLAFGYQFSPLGTEEELSTPRFEACQAHNDWKILILKFSRIPDRIVQRMKLQYEINLQRRLLK